MVLVDDYYSLHILANVVSLWIICILFSVHLRMNWLGGWDSVHSLHTINYRHNEGCTVVCCADQTPQSEKKM